MQFCNLMAVYNSNKVKLIPVWLIVIESIVFDAVITNFFSFLTSTLPWQCHTMPAKYLNLLVKLSVLHLRNNKVAMRGFCVMTRQALYQLFQLCPTALIQHIPGGLLHHKKTIY